MTNNQHGQVPEALIDLIDAYAETRHRYGRIHNARTEAARNAVIEALSGVQALSAAPEAFLKSVIALCSHRGYSPANIEAWDKDDKWIADLWRQAESMLAASPTPPAEQQAVQPGAVYANKPDSVAWLAEYGGDVFTATQLLNFADRTHALRMQAAPKAAPGDAIDEAMRERDDAEDFIDALLDEVLGHERPEWSNLYGRADALNDVQERITSLHKPAVDKAWGQFQSAMAAPQQEAQEPAHPSCKSDMTVNGGALNVLRRAGKTEVADELEKTAQPAPATQQPEGDVVAYLDVGANGYLDLGSELSEDALQQLPKGRHALVIAGTYGIDGYVAAPQLSPTAQTGSVPAIQGEMNVQLDIDSNHSAPGQQRDVARSVALGQPMGNGQYQAAVRPSAQGDKLLTVAERNIRSFLRSAQFKCESDREAALNCVDVLWAAARDPADSVQEDAARYRFLAGHCRSTSEHWGGRWSIVVDGPAPKSHDSEDDFDEAVDAALAARGGE